MAVAATAASRLNRALSTEKHTSKDKGVEGDTGLGASVDVRVGMHRSSSNKDRSGSTGSKKKVAGKGSGGDVQQEMEATCRGTVVEGRWGGAGREGGEKAERRVEGAAAGDGARPAASKRKAVRMEEEEEERGSEDDEEWRNETRRNKVKVNATSNVKDGMGQRGLHKKGNWEKRSGDEDDERMPAWHTASACENGVRAVGGGGQKGSEVTLRGGRERGEGELERKSDDAWRKDGSTSAKGKAKKGVVVASARVGGVGGASKGEGGAGLKVDDALKDGRKKRMYRDMEMEDAEGSGASEDVGERERERGRRFSEQGAKRGVMDHG